MMAGLSTVAKSIRNRDIRKHKIIKENRTTIEREREREYIRKTASRKNQESRPKSFVEIAF